MPITDAMANQFKQDAFDGVHLPADVYKAVLIKAGYSGTYDAASTYANVTGNGDECPATGGYSTGGMTLSGRASSLAGGTAYLDFSDLVIAAATISAAGVMILNSSRSNKVLGVYNTRNPGTGAIETITSTNGTFTLNLPRTGSGVLSIG